MSPEARQALLDAARDMGEWAEIAERHLAQCGFFERKRRARLDERAFTYRCVEAMLVDRANGRDSD